MMCEHAVMIIVIMRIIVHASHVHTRIARQHTYSTYNMVAVELTTVELSKLSYNARFCKRRLCSKHETHKCQSGRGGVARTVGYVCGGNTTPDTTVLYCRF
jgi:hypothetical protein